MRREKGVGAAGKGGEKTGDARVVAARMGASRGQLT